MTLSYLVVVALLVITPGADTVLVLRNTLAAGRRAGITTALGVTSGAAVQGSLASIGVGAFIVRAQPLFQAMKWVGVAYLVWLGVQSLRSAWRGQYGADLGSVSGGSARGYRQGLLCNITNPKMFVFFLALLPQFVASSAPVTTWLAHALVLPAIATGYLLVLAVAIARVRALLLRRSVRRAMDATSGVVLLGFGARLAAEA